MAAQRSSKGTPRRGFLSSHPFWPRSQQQPSPPDCPPIPILQLPAAAPSGGFPSLSGVCRAPAWINCVVLTPLRRSHIGCFTLRWLQMLLFCSNRMSWIQGSPPCFSSPIPGCRLVLLSLILLLPSFLCSTEFFMDRYIPVGWSGTPASIHLLLGEKFCI